MSFALLPVHLAVIKLLLALVMVLLIVPLLCKFILKAETDSTRHNVTAMAQASEAKGFTAWIAKALSPVEYVPGPHGPLASIGWFANNLWPQLFLYLHHHRSDDAAGGDIGRGGSDIHHAHELVSFFPTGNAVLILIAMLVIALVASFVPAP